MAKTFLQLVTALRQECDGGTPPTTVVSQSGDHKRFVDWIAQADEEIQQEHDDWKFMVGSFSLNTVADDGSYTAADCVTPVTDMRSWKRETLKIYLLSVGVADETPLHFISYEKWYATYNTGTQTSSRPLHFTVGNDMSIKLGPAPNAVYRISGEYQKSVDTMTVDADTPNYPSEFHMLPVYMAMMKYGRFEVANEVYQDGSRLYAKMKNRMELTQLPEIHIGGELE